MRSLRLHSYVYVWTLGGWMSMKAIVGIIMSTESDPEKEKKKIKIKI